MIQQHTICGLLFLCLFNFSSQAMVEVQTKALTTSTEQQNKWDQQLIALIKDPLHTAQSIARVKNYLKLGANPHTKDELGTPALILATQAEHGFYCFFLAKALLDADADINAQDQQGYTALMWTAKLKRADLAAGLLLNNARKNIINNDNECYNDIASTRFIKEVNGVLAYYKSKNHLQSKA